MVRLNFSMQKIIPEVPWTAPRVTLCGIPPRGLLGENVQTWGMSRVGFWGLFWAALANLGSVPNWPLGKGSD